MNHLVYGSVLVRETEKDSSCNKKSPEAEEGMTQTA